MYSVYFHFALKMMFDIKNSDNYNFKNMRYWPNQRFEKLGFQCTLSYNLLIVRWQRLTAYEFQLKTLDIFESHLPYTIQQSYRNINMKVK